MSIAYLDPGNIESDLQSGAVAGFKVNIYSYPVLLNTQYTLTSFSPPCMLDSNLRGYVQIFHWQWLLYVKYFPFDLIFIHIVSLNKGETAYRRN